MPGQGRVVERPYTAEERAALGESAHTLGRDHLRHPPQRPRLLAKRPGRSLELQAGRVPGPEEVALLPRARRPGQTAATGRGAALHGHRAADSGDPGAGE